MNQTEKANSFIETFFDIINYIKGKKVRVSLADVANALKMDKETACEYLDRITYLPCGIVDGDIYEDIACSDETTYNDSDVLSAEDFSFDIDENYYKYDPEYDKGTLLDFTLNQVIAIQESLKKKYQDTEIIRGILKKVLSRSDFFEVQRYYKGMGSLLDKEDIKEKWSILEEAVINERKISFIYSKKTGGSEIFKTFPLGLFLEQKTGFPYLIGVSNLRKPLSPQYFRVDRINRIELLDSFDYPEDFKLNEYQRKVWGVQPDKAVRVKVKFYDEASVIQKALKELKYRYPPESYNLQKEDKETVLIFEWEVTGLKSFRSWLLGFGSSVEVLEPEQLRQSMIETAIKMKRFYSDGLSLPPPH